MTPTLDTTLPTPLLGGLSPQRFMRRHWQKKPLLVRQAVPGGVAWASRQQVVALAASDDLESRVVSHGDGGWALRHGPFKRSALPAWKQRQWTLLVQGVDLELDAARELLDRFAFIAHARLDDLMLSYASDGGGVGPHVDSYDVFLLQAAGRRRWRIGRCRDAAFVPDLPLKILARFDAEHEWLLEPGDMLYLPPGWGHDGVAEGECVTASIGFRSPRRDDIGRELLQRLVDDAPDPAARNPLYIDPAEAATGRPGRIELSLQDFARRAALRLLADPRALDTALGEVLSEPKPRVWFDAGAARAPGRGVRLDRRSRMLYDGCCVYLNGEAYRAGERDRRLLRQLADARRLGPADVARLSSASLAWLDAWVAAGWLCVEPASDEGAVDER